MSRTIETRFGGWMVLVVSTLLLAAAGRPVLAADGGAPVKKAASKRGHRLPPHYSKVINDRQREAIYKIEDQYQPKIEALQKQLDALKNERAEKISALLSAEQKKQIETAAANAKANRKSKSRTAPKPADQTPPTPRATPTSPPVNPAPAK